jgi:hypothetical protein
VTPHDGPVASSRRAAVRDREETVVARLRSLGTAMDGEPDPAFREATRARLVAMAAVRSPEPAPQPAPAWRRLLALRATDAPASRGRRRLTAGLAAAALAVTAVATLVAVSTGARPGDVLYGLKRGTEQTQLALAGDARGQTLLGFASTRLAELAALHSPQDGALAVSTLRMMDQQATEGAAWLTSRAVQTRSSLPVHDLATWSGGQRAALATAAPAVPASARDAAARSLDLLTRIGVRADALSTAVSCPSGAATRGSDALGPIPAPCPSAPPVTGGNTVTGPSGSPPQAGTTTTGVPTSPPAGGGGSAPTAGNPGSTGTAGTNTVPTPALPGPGGVVPTPGPTPPITIPLPPLPPLPGSPGSTGSAPRTPGLGLCLPPLATVGNC